MRWSSAFSSRFIDDAVANVLAQARLDEAIRRARFLGELLWKNGLGQYQLMALERALLDRFDAACTFHVGTRLCRFGHVLTKAYDTGGHTRLVERLVGSEAMGDSAVVVLEAASALAAQRLAKARHGLRSVSPMHHGSARVLALASEFSRYQVLVLHIHPHDIEATLAAALAKKHAGVRVLLYNHADHVFTYGLSVAERVLEISHFGWALRGLRGTGDRSFFVGIPLQLATHRQVHQCLDGPIVAAGSAYKFRPALGQSFPRFLVRLCQRVDCDIQVVGPRKLVDWWWWPARWLLGRRLKLRRRLDYEQYLNVISTASAYVDSFPYVGGTAFAEVVARGVSCFGVLTGTHGYSPADLLKSPSEAQLLEALVAYSQSGVREEVDEEAVYRHMREAHDVERVAERIMCALDGDSSAGPGWPCVKEIDATAFERIWVKRALPVFPVHTRPVLKMIGCLLLMKMMMRVCARLACVRSKVE